MKVIVREKADADLDNIFQWIAGDNPRAAAAMVARIPSPSRTRVYPSSAIIGLVEVGYIRLRLGEGAERT